MIVKIKKIVINSYKKINKPSFFLTNILSVFTGATIAQFIPLVTAPILTRIYEPTDYGILGILMSISGLAGVFSTMGYSNAIIIAKTEEETKKLVGLCLKNLLIATIVCLIVIVIFINFIANIFNIENHSEMLYSVPISLLLSGIGSIFGLFATRYRYFKMIAANKVISAIIGAVCSIFIGLLYKNVIGLIIGFLVSQCASSLVLLYFLNKKHQIPSVFEFLKQHTKIVATNFNNFPKYVLPSDFINSFSNLLPMFILSSYAVSPNLAVGYYNMSNRILGLPIGLISNSIGDVFKQRAASDYNEFGSCRPIFIKTFKALLTSSIIPFAILIIFGADIFALAFGEKWRGAGEYSQILGVMFFFRFTVSPLSYVFYVANKQKFDFYLHLLFIVIGYVSLYLGIEIFDSVIVSLWLFSIGYSLIYMIYFVISYKITINRNYK